MTLFCFVLIFVVLAVISVSLYGSFQIVQVPLLATPYAPSDFGWPFEEARFTSFDGLKLVGWFVPADAPSPYTIVINHGVGSNAGDSLLNTACLRNGGKWNLFYYNFRAHGGSEGGETSLGPLECKDMDSALVWLKANKPEACERLAIYGHSLGAAVAIVGSVAHPELEGVLAESSFATLAGTVAHFAAKFYGLPFFPFVPMALFFASCRMRTWLFAFAPVKAIGQISPRPILMIQGERDRRMPMSDARALFAAARDPKELWVVPGADHGDPWMIVKEQYEKRLVDFFAAIFNQPRPPHRS